MLSELIECLTSKLDQYAKAVFDIFAREVVEKNGAVSFVSSGLDGKGVHADLDAVGGTNGVPDQLQLALSILVDLLAAGRVRVVEDCLGATGLAELKVASRASRKNSVPSSGGL
jgi:hypothetical protein